jgi:hypothetical protein
MVRFSVALHAASTRAAMDLVETLRFLMTSNRLDPACQECTAWIDSDSTVHYVEGWATEADVRRRVLSSDFVSMLSVMECAKEPPLVRFDFVATTRGLDYVAEVRGETGEAERRTSDR